MSDSIQNKWRVRWGDGLIRFSGMILLIGSVVKSLHLVKAVAYMQFFGYANQTVYLIAAIELVTAALFLRRSTRAVGLLLVSAYMGGAIAAHLAYHPLTSDAPVVRFDWNHPVLGTMPAVVVLAAGWIGTWLRHPELVGAVAGGVREGEMRPMRAA